MKFFIKRFFAFTEEILNGKLFPETVFVQCRFYAVFLGHENRKQLIDLLSQSVCFYGIVNVGLKWLT